MSIALTHLASLISSLPMALDGEAESANSAGLGVVSVVSIGITYVVLLALWFFVFRDRSGSKRKKDSSD
jgi:branched-subunit amino acid ABC-type transport system permease component